MQSTKITRLLLPHYCLLCDGVSDTDYDLCAACQQDLPVMPIASPWQLALGGSPYRVYIPWRYQPPLNKLILALKLSRKLAPAQVLGQLLAAHLAQAYQDDELPQCIIPVPLHRSRLRQRGYNQTQEIARPISKALQIPIDYQCCERKKKTAAQAELQGKERATNVRHAFHLSKPSPYKHIAILDDVITTGHTLAECAKIFHNSGTQRIDIWALAKAPLSTYKRTP